MENIHGVKRLGYAVLLTLLFFGVIFFLLILVYLGKATISEVAGHITMVITTMTLIGGGYLGVQTATDKAKINGNGNNTPDSKQDIKPA